MGNEQSVEKVEPVEPEARQEANSNTNETAAEDIQSTQAAVTSLGVRRKAIQDSFTEGGNLMDVKERALGIMESYGMAWGKEEDSFLSKIIRGYRTKTSDFPDKKAESPQPDELPPGVSMCTCIVMLDEYPETEGIMCEQGHFISQMALNHYIKTENSKEFDEIYARKGKILCPRVIMGECTSQAYSDFALARMVDADVFEEYMKQTKRCLYQEAFEEISEKVNKLQAKNNLLETHMMEEQVRLQFQKEDGSFGGYQCPDCKFGPIDHRNCNDLRAHHEQNSGGAVISNACPICGFFTPALAQWLPWDGTFLRITDSEREKIREMWKINREEKAQLDALVNQLTQKISGHLRPWAQIRAQLVSRVNELESRRQFLLTYVSRVTQRNHSTLDLSISPEAYTKHLAAFDEQMKIVKEVIDELQTQIDQIKGSDLWKCGEFSPLIQSKMNEYRDIVVNEADEPTRRAKFVEMMDNIRGLNVEIQKNINYAKMSPATTALEKLAKERIYVHQKAEAIMRKLRLMIDKEAQVLVKVVEDAYGSFLSGFKTASDEESEICTPETPELETDENGEIIYPAGKGDDFVLNPMLLKRPTMSVQESREKSVAVRENIEKFENTFDEIQKIYASYLLEDGKSESEEMSMFMESFVSVFDNVDEEGNLKQEPDFGGFLKHLEERGASEQERVEERFEELTKMKTQLEIEIVTMAHPGADVCQAVLVVRKYIGRCNMVNGTYLLQQDLHASKPMYKNDDGCTIKWVSSWNFDRTGARVAVPEINGAWILEDPHERVLLALPEDIMNPTLNTGDWTVRLGTGAMGPNKRIEMEFGIEYLKKEKNEENVSAENNIEDELLDKDPTQAELEG